jgi:lysophospholipase L1-like esterase
MGASLALATILLGGAASPLEAQARKRVLLLGDSITAGAVSGPPGIPFADVLAQRLGDGYEVVNIGCGGSTSLDWTITHGSTLCGVFVLPNLFEGRAVPSLPAEYVTMMLGTNDATGFFEPMPIAPRIYGRAMAEIANNLVAYGAGTVIVMTPPPRCVSARRDERMRLLAYRAIVLGACGVYPRTECGPDVHTLLDPETSFENCDVHPNAEGHAAIGNALADTILALEQATPGRATVAR